MELPTTAPVQSFHSGSRPSPSSATAQQKAHGAVERPQDVAARSVARPAPTNRKSPSSLDNANDQITSALLNLLYSFHNANTADEVVLALQTLFSWFQTQTYHPTQTPPDATGPFLPIHMLRHAKNEFVQCAQIKQSRQPYVWTNVVAKQYAIILQHLLVAIQAQTQMQQARAAQQSSTQLQNQLSVSIHEAHAQYSKQQQSRQHPTPTGTMKAPALSTGNIKPPQLPSTPHHATAPQQHVPKVGSSTTPAPPTTHAPKKMTPTNYSQRASEFHSSAATNNSSLVVKVPKKKPVESKPKPATSYGVVMPPAAPSPSVASFAENPFFVDMTMRTATPGADDDHLYIPVRNINKVMKHALPKDAKVKISDEAKEFMQECVTEFILYLASETRDQAIVNKRGKSTLTGSDTLRAFYNLGMTPYGDVLGVYHDKIKVVQEEAAKIKIEKRAAKIQSNALLAAAPVATPSPDIIVLPPDGADQVKREPQGPLA
ncbi:hypothetical protein ACHHYP_08751 [Achlya hypogyna]|uniref:Transcription factor CBF/NF-Y/archaeal histone domain-containing protein n=1 Tax=Achlya hypogyna TaxID=1202772 RepID=A0A1V9ZK18_ACHHY|nr:hypothetical protein ACHHYP_08751 [Achlya hypogyna]